MNNDAASDTSNVPPSKIDAEIEAEEARQRVLRLPLSEIESDSNRDPWVQ